MKLAFINHHECHSSVLPYIGGTLSSANEKRAEISLYHSNIHILFIPSLQFKGICLMENY